jgi:thymidylate synthase (FAD)
MTVKLIQITPNPEEQIAYIARVSNPNNQDNPDYAKLLAYCIKHQHWSIFEQAFMTLEIETTRGLAAQILRHRSFTFQEFSQRYADTSLMTKGSLIPLPELRRQDLKNRQNSTDDLDPEKVKMLEKEIAQHFHDAQDLYRYMIDMGVAKECARFVLPLAVPTRLYMSGSVRSWIHYIDLRSNHGTQKEHKDIAEQCREIFKEQLPVVAEALGW